MRNESTDEFREELQRIYDAAAGLRDKRRDDPEDEGGSPVREPRRPKPNQPGDLVSLTP